MINGVNGAKLGWYTGVRGAILTLVIKRGGSNFSLARTKLCMIAVTTIASLLFLIVVTSQVTQAAEQNIELGSPRFSTEKISLEQWEVYLKEVRAIPDIKCVDYVQFQYACDSSVQRTIWIFTRAGHAAHPAVTRAVMVARTDMEGKIIGIGIDRTWHYAGDETAYKNWRKEFVELDKRQVVDWQRMIRK